VALPRPRTLEIRQGLEFQTLVGDIKRIFTSYGVI
jgi:hypothetical protein